jgi:hypothetical protein
LSDVKFEIAACDFLAGASWASKYVILGLLEEIDERTFLRFMRWSVYRNRDRDFTFDIEGLRLVKRIMNGQPNPEELEVFFNLTADASDAEILAFVRDQRPAPPSAEVSAEHADNQVVVDDEFALAGIAPPVPAGERHAVLPVLVGRDWANGEDETPRESALLLPPPPPIDAVPAYSMRFPVRRGDEPQLVRSAFSLDRSLKALREGDVRTKEADLLPWPELNDYGEYFISDEFVEVSLMAYHPDRRARLIAMSPETAGKFGVVFGFGRPAQPWLAARLENGVIIKGLLNRDTWARVAAALARAPKAGALPPQEPEPPRQKRRMPDRFIRPIEPIGSSWAG